MNREGLSESELDYDKDDFRFADYSDIATSCSRLASAISPLPISCESSQHLHSSQKHPLYSQRSSDMKPPLRIAILECDTPLEPIRAKYGGGYGGVFTALLNTAAEALGRPDVSSTQGLELSAFDVVSKQEYPDLDKIDAVLLSGSSTPHQP